MTELVAVQKDFALFNVHGRGVVVNTVEMNASDPEPLTAALSRGTWTKTSVDPLPVWVELAEAAVGDAGVVASADRAVRVPQKVQDAAVRALRARKTQDSDFSTKVALKAATKLSTGTVPLSTVKRIHQFFTTTPPVDVPLVAGGSITTAGLTWLAWGGDAGRDWAAKTVASALIAAGEIPTDPDLPDPGAQHDFVPDLEDPTVCMVCGLPEVDPAHAPVDAPQGDGSAAPTAEYFGIFDPEFNGPTFKISSVLAKDTGGAWWVREQGDWSPTEAPTDGAELTMLDEESLVAAISQLDKPGATVAELSFNEDELFTLAADELDMDMYDAMFRIAPYVPPAVRSANASKQLRDTNGRFFKPGAQVAIPGGKTGTVSESHGDGTISVRLEDGSTEQVSAGEVKVAGPNSHEGDTAPAYAEAPKKGDADWMPPTDQVPGQKARLDDAGVLVPDVSARLDAYAKGEDAAPPAEAPAAPADAAPVVAAGDSMLIPPPDLPATSPSSIPSPAGSAPGTPSPSDTPAVAAPADGEDGTSLVEASSKPPLYLAEVDRNDTAAVMDAYAIIPADASTGTELQSFKRDQGKWIVDSVVLVDLRGATPPPIVELDDAKLQSVLSQMDPAADAAPDAAAPADAPAPDTTAMPVAASAHSVVQKFVIENGALVATGAPGPVLLRPYDGPLSDDVIAQYDKFAEGGADKNRGGAEKLRRYWTKGEGAAKIRWGEAGDFNRCVEHLSKYLGERSHGYCQLRHKDATGFYAGHAPSEQVGAHSANLPTFAEFVSSQYGMAMDPGMGLDALGGESALPVDAESLTHPFMPDDTTDRCLTCGLAEDDPVHEGDAPGDEVEPDEGEAGDILDAVSTELPIALPLPIDGLMGEDEDEEEDEGGKVTNITIIADGALGADGEPETTTEVEAGEPFRIPLVVPEGQESGDGRTFAADSLSSRDVPLALMWQPEGDDGHKGAVIVGRIDHVERTSEGLGNAYGVFDTGVHGQEALRLVRSGMLRGISADLDEFEADVLSGDGDNENKITSTKLMVSSGRLMGVTLVAKPAFANCVIELASEGENEMDGEYMADTGEARVAALLASAAPLHPPKDWFENPGLDKPTHLTVDDEGRVFGHIAAWDVDHIGLPFGTRAPRSASNYAYFQTGMLRTAEGADVPVGQLTLAGGHAPLQADARSAVKHYDDTGSAWADVAAGEDQFGIWVSGALRPSVTPEQIRVARASSPSGDWRPIKGSLELVAACCVNVPGFPVARARVASGMIQSLVAAGAMTLEMQAPTVPDDEITLSLRIEALEAAEKQRLMERALSIRTRVSPQLQQRQDALTASASAARERVNTRRSELAAQKEALVARVAAGGGLHVMPDFEEHKHPRDGHGKFRAVLAHIKDALSGHVGEGEHSGEAGVGIAHLEDAARLEDQGDHAGANAAATAAGDALKSAANTATSDTKTALQDAATAVHDAVASINSGGDAAGEVHIDDIPSPFKEMLIDAVDRMEQSANPVNPDEMLSKAKGFVTGTNALDPNAILRIIKQNMKDTANPDAPNVGPQAPRLPSAKPTVAIGG